MALSCAAAELRRVRVRRVAGRPLSSSVPPDLAGSVASSAAAAPSGPSAAASSGALPALARLRLGLRRLRRPSALSAPSPPSASAGSSAEPAPLALGSGAAAALAAVPPPLVPRPAPSRPAPSRLAPSLAARSAAVVRVRVLPPAVSSASGRAWGDGGGWKTTCGGWKTAAGTAGPATSPAPRPLLPSLSNSLSYSSLSSIRAISSQAPGRAVSHAAREHVVNVGTAGAAMAAQDPRGDRASPAAPCLVTCHYLREVRLRDVCSRRGCGTRSR